MVGSGDDALNIQYLTSCLIELDAKLDQAGPFEGRIPDSTFIRMDLALVVLEADFAGPLLLAITKLRQVLQQIHETLASVPERCDPDLNPLWEHCADFFEELLRRLDDGETPEALAKNPGWRIAASRVVRSNSPLGIFDNLEATMTRWVDRWGDEDLCTDFENELTESWLHLRGYGDSLFQRGLLDSFQKGTGKKRPE